MDDPERAVAGQPPRECQRVEPAAVDVAMEKEQRRPSAALAQAHERRLELRGLARDQRLGKAVDRRVGVEHGQWQ